MPTNTDFQEERIQQLEQDSKEVTATVREQSVQLKYLAEKIAENGKNVTDKLDAISDRIDGQMESQGIKIDEMSKKIDGVSCRVKKLEEVEGSRKKTHATIKKVIMAALLAAAGVLGTKAAEKFILPQAIADVGVVAQPTTGSK